MNIVVSTLSTNASFQIKDTFLSVSALGQYQTLKSLAAQRLLSAISGRSMLFGALI